MEAITQMRNIVFYISFYGEKLTYHKIATGNLQEGIVEYGSRVRQEDKTTRRIYGDSKARVAFSMAEQRKLKPESTMHQRIITIKRELDKAAQERMRLIRMHYRNINIRIALSAISA